MEDWTNKECSYCGASLEYLEYGGICECGAEWVECKNCDEYYITSSNCTCGSRCDDSDYRVNNIDDVLETNRAKKETRNI